VRVFLDTNVLVSAFATRGLCADLLQVVLADHQLIIGETVLEELRRTLRRKLHLPGTTIQELDTFLRQHAIVVADAAPLPFRLRDAADVPVLAEAVAGTADVMVTGDTDLLVAAGRSPVPILAPRAFWDLLRAKSGPPGAAS
jgi:uncharacterized protein